MRVQSLHLSQFKDLDADLPWAPVVVLFGANDSGKTNVLEALVAAFGDPEETRVDPHDYGRDFGEYKLVVELDGRDLEGHPDQEVLAAWFTRMIEQTSDAPDSWTAAAAHLKKVRGEGRASTIAAFLEAVYRGLREADGGGESGSDDDPLSSRWFALDPTTVTWLEQPRRGVVLDAHVWEEFFEVADFDEGIPPVMQAVRIEATDAVLGDLHARVERFIEADVDFREYVPTPRGESVIRAEYAARYGFRPFERDPLLGRDGDYVFVRPAVTEACEELTRRVNDLAPGFLARAYEIRIQANEPDDWRRVERRVSIRLRPRSSRSLPDFELDVASSGMALWTAYAVSEALRLGEEQHALRRYRRGPSRPSPSVTVFVFDEPERHLHPLAQAEAAAWIAERARAGAHVVLATHAVPFLAFPLETVEYVKVTRSGDWATVLEPITSDVLGAVSASAEALGLPPAAVIQLTRAWLVVEGEHDRKIVDAFYGRQLRQRGIQILAMRGAARAKVSFLNTGALGPLGYPFFVLLDNARAEAIKAGNLPTGSNLSEEEKVVELLVRLKQRGEADVEPFGLPYPDIICALPERAVIDYAHEAKAASDFTTWDDLRVRYASLPKPTAFKSFALEALGLKGRGPDDLVDGVLRHAQGVPRQGDPLGRHIAAIIARVH